jgi:hypothetical protein
MLASMQKGVVVKAYHYNLCPVEYQWEGVVRRLLALVFIRKAIGMGPTAVVEYVAMQERIWQIC